MNSVSAKKPKIDYNKYNVRPADVDRVLVNKYKDQLFNIEPNGFMKLNIDVWEKLSYEHLNTLQSKTMVPTPVDVDPEPYTMQLWDESNKEWVPFSLILANEMLSRKNIEPRVRIFMDKKWKEYDNRQLIEFLKDGKFEAFDDYLYGAFPPSNFVVDFGVEDGKKTITKTGNEAPRGYVTIRGMEGNYFINPEHLDWMLVNHYEQERKKEND